MFSGCVNSLILVLFPFVMSARLFVIELVCSLNLRACIFSFCFCLSLTSMQQFMCTVQYGTGPDYLLQLDCIVCAVTAVWLLSLFHVITCHVHYYGRGFAKVVQKSLFLHYW